MVGFDFFQAGAQVIDLALRGSVLLRVNGGAAACQQGEGDEGEGLALHGGSLVNDNGATVLRVVFFAGTEGGRALFAIAQDAHLLRRDAGGDEAFFDGVGAAFAEADVVFAGAAFVGVAFEDDFGLRVGAQVFGVFADDGFGAAVDGAAVVGEVDDAVFVR